MSTTTPGPGRLCTRCGGAYITPTGDDEPAPLACPMCETPHTHAGTRWRDADHRQYAPSTGYGGDGA